MSRTTQPSRREFAALVAGSAVAGVAAPLARPHATQAPGTALTAQDVFDRIKARIGVEWKPDSVDTIKAGDPSTRVTGIVTTSLASIAVLRQAAEAGANLVITSQPVFYSRADARTPPAGRGGGPGGAPPPAPPPDPVFTAKNDLIAQHNLIVLRLSDHWRQRRPDPYVQGIGEVMGWPQAETTGEAITYTTPAATLDALARDVRAKLQVRGGLRVIGDPQTRIARVALLPGSTPITASLAALPGVDAIIAGEVREWESTEYVRDVVHAGGRKGLILVGRIVSEDAGMRACATWLETIVPEVPVRHLTAGDPYWRPA